MTICSLLIVSLAACDSAEDRAKEHYERGVELAEAGDVDRALVELYNVFNIDGSHLEARHLVARLLLEEKNLPQKAYSQYLRLVEQYPDDLKARIVLAELAFLARNWDEVERHGSRATEIAPEDPRVTALTAAREYRAAAIAEDNATRLRIAARAETLLAAQADNEVLRNILIDNSLREDKFTDALEQLDWLIERDPSNVLYWRQRLSILSELGDNSGIEQQLRDMIAQFPEDPANKLALIRFYMARDDADKAEAFLRELVAEAPPEDNGARMDLIRFVAEMRGVDAALEETNKAISEAANPIPFRVMAAGLNFTEGRREEGIETLEDVLKTAEPSDETNAIKISLARMLLTVGNEVGARVRVEEVLAEDADNPEALKMRAAWLIEADETDEAISVLRIALEQASEDAQAMTLMANAYTRAGRPELARDFLALAVDASNNAPEETLRYARILISEEQFLPAEDILIKSLRLNPGDIGILVMMGQLYLAMDDSGRVDQIVRTLRDIDDPQAENAATGLEAEQINLRSGPEEAVAFLEGLLNTDDASLAARVGLVRARLGTNDLEGALTLARQLAEENPDEIALKAVLGAAEAVNGNLDAAEALYREIVDTNPEQGSIWLALSQIQARQGKPDAARETVETALEGNPEDANLLWAKASYLERDNDIDSAIEIYQELYDRNSNAVVVANNLASMLSTYRTDEESLERAWLIARRFRDANIPAVQDTYGWILHRRGESEEAIPYLEGAANGLPGDAVVQYHLGMAYLALGRNEDALAQFRRALEVASPVDQRPQIADARARIEEIQNAQN